MCTLKTVVLALLGAILLLVYGCTPTPILRHSQPPQSIEVPKTSLEKGICSFTSMERQGTRMSSGEIYNTHEFVAAHRTLPFGTLVRVTNLKNSKSVIVMIKDRGPFIRGRIIDISYAAARKLDMIKDGLVPATVEVVRRK